MIIVKLIGGLGNQLFQYALGRYLAEIHQAILKIDISGFEIYTLHKYSLGSFNIQENFASPEEVMALKVRKEGVVERGVRQLLRRRPKPAPSYIREKHFHFDPDILNLSDGIYLDGYWQSEKYFANIPDIIRQEFTVKTPLTGQNEKMSELMRPGESVSLHIRRGDYVSNAKFREVYGSCSLDYYIGCVKYLTRRVKDPHFFIFSDDSEWARDYLRLSYSLTFIDHNGADKNYEDLRLMSLCRHNIIANSTFSWWGAWLNQNPEKIVLAPKHWFKRDDYDIKDLIPEKWIKV